MYKDGCILRINGGSPSIKFSLYKIKEPLEQLFYGEIENMGTQKAKLNFTNSVTEEKSSVTIQATDYDEAANNLIDWLEKHEGFDSIKAIGHRIVHSMEHTGA